VSRLHASICAVLLLAVSLAHAHDPSAYGGLFRSRNLGQTWLNADVGLFLSSAISLAVHPVESNRLLLGTDTGLLYSESGGRQWQKQAPERLFGAVFAVMYLPGGEMVLCATPGGVFRFAKGEWSKADAPVEAAPARAMAQGASADRAYLLGRRSLYRSDDAGVSWQRVEHSLPDDPELTALAVATEPTETLYAIADGALIASADGGRNWGSRNAGLPASAAEALTLDPTVPGRLWVAADDRLYSSDDGGARWRAVGAPLPEPGTSVRGIAADARGEILVITTHRGVYRSTDAGRSWALLEDNLPVHLEARPLVRDPSHADTLYAGYSLLPYGEAWRIALEGGNLLSRVPVSSLLGGLAFLLLLVILGVLAARWLAQRQSALASRTPSSGNP
jgi:photosystem II stability/assembly factor-like uncharacterized protein